MAKAMKSTVVIPAFNNVALTEQCLNAVLEIGGCEVVVVDDASTDGTLKMLGNYRGKIRIITHKTNQGFARTCNDGAKAARTEFVVFLNNDTVPQSGWLRALERYAQKNPKAAVIGARLLYPDQTVQHAGVVICQDLYPRHIYTGFAANHPVVSRSRRFQIVTAAAMLVRKKVFIATGQFDSKFKNGFEDVDFCLRVGERGHEIHYCAKSIVQHFESVSPGRFKRDKDNVALYRQRWLAKVKPDDLNYYLADGLLALGYEGQFPVHLKVAPELAVLDAGRDSALEKSLAEKSRRVADLSREVTRLRVELGQLNPASQAIQADRDREALRQQVLRATPPDARVLIVSKGDTALLQMDRRNAQHFPQAPNGVYLGHHPADSADAIRQLDALCLHGAEFLVIPHAARWWLTYYKAFHHHLKTRGEVLMDAENIGIIFDLRRLAQEKRKKRRALL